MAEVNSAAALPLQASVAQSATPARTKEAAADFEALLIAQMLRSARSASSLTSLDGEEAGSNDAVLDFAEQQLSSTLASAGGLGLATLVAEGLTQPAGRAKPLATKPNDTTQS